MLNWIKNGFPDEEDMNMLIKLVLNGIPLPKSHGDLKDMSNLKYVFDVTKDNPIYSGKDIERAIKSMVTIIPANEIVEEKDADN